MGYIAAGPYGVDEPLWRLLAPIPEGPLGRQMVEGVIDLYGVELVFVAGRPSLFILCILLLIVLESVHLLQRRIDWRAVLKFKPVWIRWAVYYSLVISIMLLGSLDAEPFIYFQF